MASTLIGNISGGDPIVSGNPWSGSVGRPVGGIQLVWDGNASGYLYVALSGGVTYKSGGFYSSGGAMDGVQIGPGGNYFIPRMSVFQSSGVVGPHVLCDQTASGLARLFIEYF